MQATLNEGTDFPFDGIKNTTHSKRFGLFSYGDPAIFVWQLIQLLL